MYRSIQSTCSAVGITYREILTGNIRIIYLKAASISHVELNKEEANYSENDPGKAYKSALTLIAL